MKKHELTLAVGHAFNAMNQQNTGTFTVVGFKEEAGFVIGTDDRKFTPEDIQRAVAFCKTFGFDKIEIGSDSDSPVIYCYQTANNGILEDSELYVSSNLPGEQISNYKFMVGNSGYHGELMEAKFAFVREAGTGISFIDFVRKNYEPITFETII